MKETYVAVFGGQPYLSATAHAVAAAAGMKTAELDGLLDMSLDESEGLLVPLYGVGKSAIHLKRPP